MKFSRSQAKLELLRIAATASSYREGTQRPLTPQFLATPLELAAANASHYKKGTQRQLTLKFCATPLELVTKGSKSLFLIILSMHTLMTASIKEPPFALCPK